VENPRELESTFIHPFVKVHLLRRVKLPQNVNYYLPEKDGIGGGGGEELPKIFTMVLNSSQKSEFYAPQIEENNESYYFFNGNINEIQLSKEIIYLKPSGMTYFTVDIEMESGYLYEFTVSVYYKSDVGFVEVKSPEKYRCAVPDSIIALSDSGPTNRMVFDKPLRNRTFTLDELKAVDNDRIEELRREIVKAIAKKKYIFPYLRESSVIDTDNSTLSKMR